MIRQEKEKKIRSRAEMALKIKEEQSLRDYRSMVAELAQAGGSYSNLSSARKRIGGSQL